MERQPYSKRQGTKARLPRRPASFEMDSCLYLPAPALGRTREMRRSIARLID